MNRVKKNPNSFCWTPLYKPERKQMNVGLNVYNMMLYNTVFRPRFNEMYWDLPRGDVYFMGAFLSRYPDLKNKLKIRLLDSSLVSTGKHQPYVMADGKTTWDDNKTMHYHGWKGEYNADASGFIDTWNFILSSLKEKAEKQLDI